MELPVINGLDLDLDDLEDFADIEEYLNDYLYDSFDITSWSELPHGNVRYFEWENKIYKWEIFEDGCCEATHSHCIMYWRSEVSEAKHTMDIGF